MTTDGEGVKYTTGIYGKKRASAAELADRYIRQWEEKRLQMKKEEAAPELPPTICFSRKMGVGALEIADILAKNIGCQVVDREILEYIANRVNVSEKTVAFYDERYPGKINEFLSFVFGEKAFTKGDYTRHLFSSVYSIANLAPTIFVGRGTHLLLPRDRVLAIRFICTKEHRIDRLARVLNVKEDEAEKELDRIDRGQREFFISVYGKKDAPPYEFDMIINCNYINKPQWAAEIVGQALKEKFGSETSKIG